MPNYNVGGNFLDTSTLKMFPELRNTKTVDVNVTSKVLGASDANTLQRYTLSSAGTITIPQDSTYNYDNDTEISFTYEGTGALTVAKEASVNIFRNGDISVSSITLAEKYGVILLKKIAANSWRLYGLSSGVTWSDISGKPTQISDIYKFNGSAVPTGQVNGDKWLEYSATSVRSWYWDSTLSVWLSTEYLPITPPAGVALGGASDRSISVPIIPSSAAIRLERIGIKGWTSTAHSSTNNFVFTPGFLPRNATSATNSTNYTAFDTQTLTANTTDMVDFGTNINQTLNYLQFAYLRLNITRTGTTATMNYNAYVNARLIR